MMRLMGLTSYLDLIQSRSSIEQSHIVRPALRTRNTAWKKNTANSEDEEGCEHGKQGNSGSSDVQQPVAHCDGA